jgi:sRNA-binding regulator protein Hfq
VIFCRPSSSIPANTSRPRHEQHRTATLFRPRRGSPGPRGVPVVRTRDFPLGRGREGQLGNGKSIFFNIDPRGQFISPAGNGPKLTGTVAGFPEYNNWVVISKDGRLPWIPQTLEEKLAVEGNKRRAALAEWTTTRAGMKGMDAGALRKTYEAVKKTDPAGAEKMLADITAQTAELERLQREVYPLTTMSLEGQIKAFDEYRTSFTSEELQSPAVWWDESGAARRQLDAEIAALQKLSADEQRELDNLSKEASAFGRQAQVETKKQNATEAARLRAQANELGMKARVVRQRHVERAAPLMNDARARFELTNLQPGPAERAISYKPDPTFPDPKDPNRIQLITVLFSTDPDPKQTVRRAWQQQAKESFDWRGLAALLK